SLSHGLELIGFKFTQKLPMLSVTAIGDGTNVLTRGKLTFSEPLSLELEPWTIPTNLVSSPLVSFTAIRGFASLVAPLKAWKDLHSEPAPNQIFIWAAPGMPAQTYFAVPHRDASNLVSKINRQVLEKGAT